MTEKETNTDIILPVYNAYESLVRCIDSVKKYTDLNRNRLILINDCSSDERILPYINSLSQNNILVLSNSRNLGFSGTINRGIEQGRNDVLLLNSDTIVTKNWLQKIAACAYRDQSIGTVTPLSNNASICSVPVTGQDNAVPEGFTIEEFAELIERCSLHEYPTIPVAVGFCMFIKREVLDCTGTFDAGSFPRGYGEEIDFCCRAEQFGYHHIMCDDTFIYHEGTASFLDEEKKKLVAESEKILKKRYKEQMDQIHQFWIVKPHEKIAQNVLLHTKLDNRKKNIFYLLQADFREDAGNNVGGTQFHVKDLVLRLRNRYNLFVAARDGEYLRVTAYTEKDRISFRFLIGKPLLYPVFFDETLRKLYRNLLTALRIDVVHIHHTYQLSLDLYYVAKELGIPLFATLHDYYYICPTIKLLNQENQLCIGNENEEMCRQCLQSQLHIAETVPFLSKWRAENKKALLLCSKLFTPSESSRKIILRYFPELDTKIQVIEHGSDPYFKGDQKAENNIQKTDQMQINIENFLDNKARPNAITGWTYLEGKDASLSKVFIEIADNNGEKQMLPCRKVQRADVAKSDGYLLCSGFDLEVPSDIFKDGDLKVRVVIENRKQYFTNGKIYSVAKHHFQRNNGFNIAFIGGINIAKGSQYAYNMIKNSPKTINWFIFGGIGDGDLLFLERDNLTKTNWYQREHLPFLLKEHKIQLVCILPIWPETFCYTLSEALLCGVPTIVTDQGALGERAKALDCGWVVPADASWRDVLNLIDKIRQDPTLYQKKLQKVQQLHLRDTSEMAADYIQIYENCPAVEHDSLDFSTSDLYYGYLLGNPDSAIAAGSGVGADVYKRLNMVESELQAIYSSIGYKALIAIKRLPIPFKPQIKAFMFKCYNFLKKWK